MKEEILELKLYMIQSVTDSGVYTQDFHILSTSALKAGAIAEKVIAQYLDIYKQLEITNIELLTDYNIFMEKEDGN